MIEYVIALGAFPTGTAATLFLLRLLSFRVRLRSLSFWLVSIFNGAVSFALYGRLIGW
jgi:hypothetical protein